MCPPLAPAWTFTSAPQADAGTTRYHSAALPPGSRVGRPTVPAGLPVESRSEPPSKKILQPRWSAFHLTPGGRRGSQGSKEWPPRAQEGQSWGSERDSTLPEAAVPLCLPSPCLKLHTGREGGARQCHPEPQGPQGWAELRPGPSPNPRAETPPLRKIILVVECKGTARAGGERQGKKSKSDGTAKLKWDIFPRV